MEIFNQFKSDTLETINSLFYKIGEGIISFLYAILVLVIGWLITKLIVFILEKALRVSKIESLSDKLNEAEIFGKPTVKLNFITIITSFVKWILLLVFFIIAADVMQWKIISVEISNLLRYLPRLFSAIVLFMVGIYIANFVKKAIYGLFQSIGLSGAKMISSLVFYGIGIIITITSLNQAGIDTSIITNNVTIVLGAFLLTFAIAFGLGSKDVVRRLLLTFYTRKNYSVGEKISVNGITGEIESIENICLIVKTENGKMVIPIDEIVENRVEIKE